MRKTSSNKAKGKKNRPKPSSAYRIWNSRKPQSSEALVLPTRGADTSALSMSSPGTVQNLAFNKTVVLRYRFQLEERGLAPGTINVRIAAVKRLAYEAADSGLLSPELAAGIHLVQGVRKLGSRLATGLQRARRRHSGRYAMDKL